MDRKSTKEAATRTRSRAANPEAPPDSDAIARRAYALYEARGRTPGHENEDWLEAERQLVAERQTPAPTAASPTPARGKGKRTRPPEAEV